MVAASWTRRAVAAALAVSPAARWEQASQAAAAPQRLTLQRLPPLGRGTCCDEPEAARAQALLGLSAGYRLLDTSAHYPSEEVLGEAVDEAVARVNALA